MSASDMLFKQDAQFQLNVSGDGTTFVNFCGITSLSVSGSNEIIEIKDGNCTDPAAAVEIIKNYGARNASVTVNYNAYKSSLPIITDWDENQKKIAGRITFPNAATGELQFIDAIYLLESFTFEDIENLDGNPITGTLSLQASGGLGYTIAP